MSRISVHGFFLDLSVGSSDSARVELARVRVIVSQL